MGIAGLEVKYSCAKPHRVLTFAVIKKHGNRTIIVTVSFTPNIDCLYLALRTQNTAKIFDSRPVCTSIVTIAMEIHLRCYGYFVFDC